MSELNDAMTTSPAVPTSGPDTGRDDVRIGPATADDYDAALELWARSEGVGAIEPRDVWDRVLARNPGLTQTARDRGRLVGVVMASHDGRRGTLYHLAVDGAYRRRGVAGRLVAAARRALAAEGIARVFASAFARNVVGVAFWERQGWERRDDLVVFDTRDRPPGSPEPDGEAG